MKLTSYTLTLHQVRQMIWDTDYRIALDNQDQKGILRAARMAFEDSVHTVANTWCELHSDYWFDQNPGISDVLMLLPNGEKIWLASDIETQEMKKRYPK